MSWRLPGSTNLEEGRQVQRPKRCDNNVKVEDINLDLMIVNLHLRNSEMIILQNEFRNLCNNLLDRK